ncbi:hypothetical protein BJY01DRAFT_57649 [Aspergillus pseudoustus]|uniref:Uncharacterized protein n=1 Tax=Aspergillus pseudoustus TaxID=1810923 RepID=A0ABR4KNF1_9EURO
MQDYSTPSCDSQKLRPSHQTTTTDSSSSSFYLFATVLEVCVLFSLFFCFACPSFFISEILPANRAEVYSPFTQLSPSIS